MAIPKMSEDQAEAFAALQDDFLAPAIKQGWLKAGAQGVDKSYAFAGLEHADHPTRLCIYLSIDGDEARDKFIMGSKVLTADEAIALVSSQAVPPTVPPTGDSSAAHSAAHTEDAVPPTEQDEEVPPTTESDAAHTVPPTEQGNAAHTKKLVTTYDVDGIMAEHILEAVQTEADRIDKFAEESARVPLRTTILEIDFNLNWNEDESAAYVTVNHPDSLSAAHLELAENICAELEDSLMLDNEIGQAWISECQAAEEARLQIKSATEDTVCESELKESVKELIEDPTRLWSPLVSQFTDQEILDRVVGKVVHWKNSKAKVVDSAMVSSTAKNHVAQVTGDILDGEDYRTLSFLAENGGFRSVAVCRIVKITKK